MQPAEVKLPASEHNEKSQADAKALFGMSADELRAVAEGLGLPKYRAVQLAEALYKQRVGTLEEITTLPVEVRERLAAEGYHVGLPEMVQTAKECGWDRAVSDAHGRRRDRGDGVDAGRGWW